MIMLLAAPRNKPAFHWVRNLLHKFTPEEITDFDAKQCSAFAFFWNWLYCHLNKDILKNFDDWMGSAILPHMTSEWQKMSKTGSYTINLPGCVPLKFNNVKLAPPTDVMAPNYARYVN